MQEELLAIYEKLLAHFGRQGWWPLIDAATGASQYHVGVPSNEEERFEICVGAILAQNTQWDPNVVKALRNLKQQGVLDKKHLATISLAKLGSWITPAGYFNQKAKKLQIFAQYRGPITRDALLDIWGLGPETVDSILLYAYGQPYFVIDAYTKRILTRLGFGEKNYDELRQLLMEHLPNDVNLYKEFHALFVALGKDICLKQHPLCSQCPLQKLCAYARSHTK
ncbi:hypothetical protein HYS50_03260 [Candidatus Woesearchaeota archaeon]|nr:hypothetical protein [Candidatus Woesearchaeota archaeon]